MSTVDILENPSIIDLSNDEGERDAGESIQGQAADDP